MFSKISPRVIPHSKHVSTPKRTKLHHLKKLSEGMPPNPPRKAQHANLQISKNYSCPTPPKSWLRPWQPPLRPLPVAATTPLCKNSYTTPRYTVSTSIRSIILLYTDLYVSSHSDMV